MGTVISTTGGVVTTGVFAAGAFVAGGAVCATVGVVADEFNCASVCSGTFCD